MTVRFGLGVRAGAGTWLPTDAPGCVLWLRADLGITTVDAAVLSPNDLSTASWSAIGLSARTASRITEDSSTGTHVAMQNTGPLNLHTNHLYHVKVGLPAASGDGRYALVYSGSGADGVKLDLQTGATTPFGTPTNVTYAGGVLDYDCISTTGVNLYLSTWNGVSGISFVGNGLRYVQFGDNGLGALATVTQRNVSAWADQSGSGHNLLQATGAAQPLYEAAGLGGRPSVRGDGVNDRLKAVAFTLNQPTTIISAGQYIVQQSNGTLWDGNVLNSLRLFDSGTFQMYAGAYGPEVARTLTPHVWSAVYNGASSTLRQDNGTPATGNAGSNNAGGFTLFTDGGAGARADARFGEVCIYDRALSAAEQAVAARYMGARYGITVA